MLKIKYSFFFEVAISIVVAFALVTGALINSAALDVEAQSVPKFAPNFVMSDQTFSSTRAFPTEDSVQAYLDRVNSPLRNYSENGRRASSIIFAASRGETSSMYGVTPQINPGVILAILEKETSLVTMSSYDVNGDPEGRMRIAMGYGCPDFGNCAQDFQGFSNQIKWAAYQMQLNFNGASRASTLTAPYNVGNRITTLDEYSVTLSNASTAACYRYTPHVYFGCYNLWKIITMNGWGVSTLTYSAAALDAENLGVNRFISSSEANAIIISQEEGNRLANQTYTIGTVSHEVRKLQVFLRQEGYFLNQNITSSFGPITSQSLLRYRQEKGILPGQNNISQRCRDVIATDFAAGTTGDNVRELQSCLVQLGLFSDNLVTGFYGPLTTAAHASARGSQSSQPPTSPTQSQTPANNSNPASGLSQNCQNTLGRNYQIGQSGNSIRQLQTCLQEIGLYSWPAGVTGFFGNYTNGKYNEWLNNGRLTCSILRTQNYQLGERSERVRRLQQCLREAGTFSFPTNTGLFGSITQEALRQAR